MNAAELLETLCQRGATVEARGDHLRIDAPRGAVTDELRADLAVHKAELLRLLAGSLNAWLAKPVPQCTSGFVEAQTVAELKALVPKLSAYLYEGRRALDAAPLDDPDQAAAEARWREQHARSLALGDLLKALAGKPYDRRRLGTWTAGELFKAGEMAAMLKVMDSIATDGSTGS